MSRDETYNGWTNRSTWAIHLWLSNDQGTDEYARELVSEARSSWQAADALKEWVEGMAEEVLTGGLGSASLWTDLLSYSLAEADWVAIAEAFGEE